MSDRKQYVQWDNAKSAQKSITYGVPQGSILRPLLFVFYANDLLSAATLNCSYADCKIVLMLMTPVFYSGKKSGVVIPKMVKEVSQCLSLNKLTLNADKCENICFGASSDKPNDLNLFKKMIYA